LPLLFAPLLAGPFSSNLPSPSSIHDHNHPSFSLQLESHTAWCEQRFPPSV
jgi:hypothetical protein